MFPVMRGLCRDFYIKIFTCEVFFYFALANYISNTCKMMIQKP